MSIRFTLLLSSAAMLALSAPASAQDEHTIHAERVEIMDTTGSYDGEWQGRWQDANTWRGTWNGRYTTQSGEVLDGAYTGTFIGDGRFVTDDGRVFALGDDGWREHGDGYEVHVERRQFDLAASPDGRLGYSLAEREAWLSDCRLLMADQGGYARYDDRDDDWSGGLVGGLLGAVVGGFAGNRIDDDGSRLAGTLIGAGLGGVAGAVIGSAIDGVSDDRRDYREFDANELWAARYCDAYLRRYEMGGGAGFASQTSYGQPLMLVQTAAAGSSHGHHGHRHGPECTTTIRDEWVEIETPTPAPRPARRLIPRPRPEGKTTKIQ